MRNHADFFAVALLALVFAGPRMLLPFTPDRFERQVERAGERAERAGERIELKLQRITDRHNDLQSDIEKKIQCGIEERLRRLL